MRVAVLSMLFTLPLLAACASSGGKSQYQQDYDRLDAACTERQGMLTPTGGLTGHPETDYACKITGGASRIRAN
jgi:uncharacterized lipoprotein